MCNYCAFLRPQFIFDLKCGNNIFLFTFGQFLLTIFILLEVVPLEIDPWYGLDLWEFSLGPGEVMSHNKTPIELCK